MDDWKDSDGVPYDANSVAALLITGAGEYLLQRRDERSDVDFPGFWGLFGGAIEPGEQPADAMARELEEELAFEPKQLAPFATLVFDERASGGWYCRRRFFAVQVQDSDLIQMEVREGAGMDIIGCERILGLPAVVPYDLCAILMYHRRAASRVNLARERARRGHIA